MKKSVGLFFMFFGILAKAQSLFEVNGTVFSEGKPLAFSNVYIENSATGAITNEEGVFKLTDLKPGTYTLIASFTGYATSKKRIKITHKNVRIKFNLVEDNSLQEVIITGTLKAVSRLESPVPVEVYSTTFLKKNPSPSVFEALNNVNGVRPQLNCNVCNTGDIHINGLEGPYSLVMIDGMPIVSGLSTVYGLSGIPNSLIEQIEIVKGPASSLYGSEALGGLINIITKLPENAPLFFSDSFVTSWGEVNLDLGVKANVGKKATVLVGANYFIYDQLIDNNNDNFTDLTNQDRISIFQKWNFKRKNNRDFSIAGRYLYEDRWGGELQWSKSDRGGNEVYGESIYTSRF